TARTKAHHQPAQHQHHSAHWWPRCRPCCRPFQVDRARQRHLCPRLRQRCCPHHHHRGCQHRHLRRHPAQRQHHSAHWWPRCPPCCRPFQVDRARQRHLCPRLRQRCCPHHHHRGCQHRHLRRHPAQRQHHSAHWWPRCPPCCRPLQVDRVHQQPLCPPPLPQCKGRHGPLQDGQGNLDQLLDQHLQHTGQHMGSLPV
ncbi:hypothetical protein BG005_004459, partial [Podila minutissima]